MGRSGIGGSVTALSRAQSDVGEGFGSEWRVIGSYTKQASMARSASSSLTLNFILAFSLGVTYGVEDRGFRGERKNSRREMTKKMKGSPTRR